METTMLTQIELIDKIKELKRIRNACILAHYYQSPEILSVADYIGDSLGLSAKAMRSDADIIVFAGVYFMAETAKILNPEKVVLIPDTDAGCSLADACNASDFKAFREQHPEYIAITYINCSAEVKALSDIICTSSNALAVINALPSSQKILFSPDRNLGHYLSKMSGREMLIWDGACIVHEAFSGSKLEALQELHPDAFLMAHPESEPYLLDKADFIGSTSAMLKFAGDSISMKFIVATEAGLIHSMRQKYPHKTFIPAPANENNTCACSECPYMKLSTLEKIYDVLSTGKNEVLIEEDLRLKALRPLERMLEYE
jgi:quinolinate synthase